MFKGKRANPAKPLVQDDLRRGIDTQGFIRQLHHAAGDDDCFYVHAIICVICSDKRHTVRKLQRDLVRAVVFQCPIFDPAHPWQRQRG